MDADESADAGKGVDAETAAGTMHGKDTEAMEAIEGMEGDKGNEKAGEASDAEEAKAEEAKAADEVELETLEAEAEAEGAMRMEEAGAEAEMKDTKGAVADMVEPEAAAVGEMPDPADTKDVEHEVTSMKEAAAAHAAATDAPVITESPAATEAPVVTEAPAAAEEPAATEVPGGMEAPAATEEAAPTEEPAAVDALVATEAPADMKEPAATEVPGAMEERGMGEDGHAASECDGCLPTEDACPMAHVAADSPSGIDHMNAAPAPLESDDPTASQAIEHAIHPQPPTEAGPFHAPLLRMLRSPAVSVDMSERALAPLGALPPLTCDVLPPLPAPLPPPAALLPPEILDDAPRSHPAESQEIAEACESAAAACEGTTEAGMDAHAQSAAPEPSGERGQAEAGAGEPELARTELPEALGAGMQAMEEECAMEEAAVIGMKDLGGALEATKSAEETAEVENTVEAAPGLEVTETSDMLEEEVAKEATKAAGTMHAPEALEIDEETTKAAELGDVVAIAAPAEAATLAGPHREMSSPVQHADDTASLAPAVASPSPHACPLEPPAPVMGGTAASVAGVALSEPVASVSAGLSAPEQVALTFSSVDAEPQPAASRAISSGDATDTRATLGFMRPPAFSLESALEPLPPLGLISPMDTVQGMASTDDQATGHVLA